MPLVWSYLLRAYFRVFSLSVSSFIAILLVTRLKEIARFAALASKPSKTIVFTLYQIPHILPIAIPISCLIAAILLFQNMSRTHELTAFRSSGFSLGSILAPVLLASFILCGINFYICSEVATSCRQKAREMLFEETTVNPLVLLQRQKLLRIKESYIDMKMTDQGNIAKDVLFITSSQNSDRLSLMSAKKFSLDKETLTGNHVALISNLGSEENQFDTLVVENQTSMTTHAPSISQFMKQNRTRLNPASLPLRFLLIRAKDKGTEENLWKQVQYGFPEILRRFSLGLAAISFTLLGSTLGMEIGRVRSQRGAIWASLLALFVFASYMLGKQMKGHFLLPCLAFTLPHFVLLFISLKLLKKIARGTE